MRFTRSTHLLMYLSLETLTFIVRTGLPILVELIDLINSVYNFSISNDLTQMVNVPTRIQDCDSHTPALLNFFLSSDASICSTIAFLLLGNSDHVVVSVSIDFPSNSQRNAPFHRIAYNYSRADCDGLRDHLTDVPGEDIFRLGASAASREFCKWVQVGVDVCIPHRKYQVKPHSSPLLSRNLALVIFGELLIVFSAKVNLPYLIYSAARRCRLLHLIKQNCLLKTSLRTLILITQVSLYLFSVLELI